MFVLDFHGTIVWGAVCIKTSFFKVFVYLLQYLYIDCTICIFTMPFIYRQVHILYRPLYFYIDSHFCISTMC